MRTLLLPCAAAALCAAPVRRDLDVAVPPGSPLEWSATLPVYTPPSAPLFPRTGPAEESARATGTVSRMVEAEADVRFANAFGQVRILTWDLGAHLQWTLKPVRPTTAPSSLRPPPPEYGDPLYWLALAPLLRMLLHPDSLSRSETLAHLVEMGESVLPVLGAAAGERELAAACRELRALIRVDLGGEPSPPQGASPRESMLARFVLEECLRDQPLDPCDDFGRRLYLFAEDAEPWLVVYAQHDSPALARNAVAALGRYRTRSAVEFLAALAGRAGDPVVLVRALTALGRYRGPLDCGPLVARLARTHEPVQRAALIGALGRLGARAAGPLLLELGEAARSERDSDLLISVLSALARIPWTQPQPEQAAFCARVAQEARELALRAPNALKADVPDSPTLRAEILEQLALLAHSQAAPQDERVRARILALPEPAPLDSRLSELGVGGIDPLGGIRQAVRFLFLEGLQRAGPGGMEALAALTRRAELETALRGRALALLPLEARGSQALALLADAKVPVELRVQALEVLIGDLHPRAAELCRAQLVNPRLAEARPAAGELFLALRAVRFLSETGVLRARELLALHPFVQRPLVERAAQIEELRARATELAEAARSGTAARELAPRAAALFDFVVEHRLNALLDPDMRDARVDALLDALEPALEARAPPEVVARVVPGMLALLLGGEAEVDDPGRALFQPLVPLAEEVLLALGRTREPLAIELVLAAIAGGARELRGHACLALGMCAQPAMAVHLLPALLDPDPFVRFAASESLRHLTGKESPIDWMTAGAAERQAAAEELKRWFLEEKR